MVHWKGRSCRIKRIDVVYYLLLIIILFQSILEEFIDVWSGFDEVLTVAVVIIAVRLKLKNKRFSVRREDIIFGAALLLYVLAGTVSSAVCQFQSLPVSGISAFLSVKWFLLFWGIQEIYANGYILQTEKWNQNVVYLLIFTVFVWENIFFFLIPGTFYGFPYWDLVAKCVFLIGLLTINWKKRTLDYISLMLLCEMLLLTERAKAYALVALVFVLMYWILRKNKRITLALLVILGLLLIIVAWDKVYFYYIEGARPEHDYARARLFKTAGEIARDYFPLGTGWGTYASHYAEKYYSPVYYIYKISEHGELGFRNRLYLKDAYWPIVLGETGVIGTAAVMLVIVWLFQKIQILWTADKRKYLVGIMIWVYMLITTVEETGFQQPVLMCLAGLLGAVLSSGYKNKVSEKE